MLVVSSDFVPIKESPASGSGLRAWYIAKTLREMGRDVVLVLPTRIASKTPGITHADSREKLDLCEKCGHVLPSLKEDDVEIIVWDEHRYKKLLSLIEPEAIVTVQRPAGYWMTVAGTELPILMDLHGPSLFEASFHVKYSTPYDASLLPYLHREKITLMGRGDRFTCAGYRQRYYFLGLLAALGRINDRNIESQMVQVVPFAAPSKKPVHDKQVLKGIVVGKSDFVILWSGAFLPWNDILTPAVAMKEVVKRIPNAHLVYVGGPHPSGSIPPGPQLEKLEEFVSKSGLQNNIHLLGWKPHKEIHNYYMEADIGVCTYPTHLETELAFRTRILDFLWSGVPTITTELDELSSTLMTEAGCAITVPPSNESVLADEIVRLLLDDKERNRISANGVRLIESRLTWERVIGPINDFCANPEIDKSNPYRLSYKPDQILAYSNPGVKSLVKQYVTAARREGVMHATQNAVKWVFR